MGIQSLTLVPVFFVGAIVATDGFATLILQCSAALKFHEDGIFLGTDFLVPSGKFKKTWKITILIGKINKLNGHFQ